MTGLELASRIAVERPGLPVLLYTGDATEFDTAELRRCGVRKLLRKPIDPKALRSTMQALLRAAGDALIRRPDRRVRQRAGRMPRGRNGR